MESISIFNHVLGPVMRGPSSSHTAGAFHIGCMARSLLGELPSQARFTFDADGSYARTYHEQGADLAFAAALMGWELTDERFRNALKVAAEAGFEIEFAVRELTDAIHPNAVDIDLVSREGKRLHARANSIGGGAVEFTRLEGWRINLTGRSHEVLVELGSSAATEAITLLTQDGETIGELHQQSQGDRRLIHVQRKSPFPPNIERQLKSLAGFERLWAARPVFLVHKGAPLFTSAAQMTQLAGERRMSLGQIALEYEAALLGLAEEEVLDEMARRLRIMQQAVHRGLEMGGTGLQLLRPTAGGIYAAEREGRLAIGGLHTRAAARAMAAMHVNSSMGVVCAAPTGGAAGTLPGVLASLIEDEELSHERALLALLAAGAIGVITANRATFAAEVAGCQVEIGAAGAMAAAAVVDAAGGTASQAADAAAIAFQNTMGSVCDLVQGIVEIPCHTRNAVAASSAFVCADLIVGGYENPIDLDETIDAVYSVGKMLPSELRCTAKGGLAMAPSALALERKWREEEGGAR